MNLSKRVLDKAINLADEVKLMANYLDEVERTIQERGDNLGVTYLKACLADKDDMIASLRESHAKVDVARREAQQEALLLEKRVADQDEAIRQCKELGKQMDLARQEAEDRLSEILNSIEKDDSTTRLIEWLKANGKQVDIFDQDVLIYNRHDLAKVCQYLG